MAKKKIWDKKDAIKDLLDIKTSVFEKIANEKVEGNECDQKLVKLAIDVIKELNSICGVKEDDEMADRGFDVKISVVDKV